MFFVLSKPSDSGRHFVWHAVATFLSINSIGHFTVVCSVTWPLNGSEAGADFVLIQTSLFCFINQVVLMITSLHLYDKAERFLSMQGDLQPRYHSKARSLSRQL